MSQQEVKLPVLPPEIWLRILEEFAPVTYSPELADDDDSDADDADDLYEEEEAADEPDRDDESEMYQGGAAFVPAKPFDADEFIDEEISDRADEILFLWLTCRQVSTLFRTLVDYIFEVRYLRQIQIRFGLGNSPDLWHDHYIRRDMPNFTFSGFEDEEKSIGVFKWAIPRAEDNEGEREREDERGWPTGSLSLQESALASAMESHILGDLQVSRGNGLEKMDTFSFPLTLARHGSPPWIVIWEGWYNDTDLPGLRIKFNGYSPGTHTTIFFRWKEAIQLFLREQKMLQDIARARSPVRTEFIAYAFAYMLTIDNQIWDKSHRDKLHELHETIHEDNESMVRDGPELVKDITAQRLAMIRQIIRHHRRGKWREETGMTWYVNPFQESLRRRELLKLERRKFRFEKWNETQETRSQMVFLLSHCGYGNRTGVCTFEDANEDRIPLDWNLEIELEDLCVEEEDLSDWATKGGKKGSKAQEREKKYFTRSVTNTAGRAS